MPLLPCAANLNGEGISLPALLRPAILAMTSEIGLPACWASIGLGSKVSTCDGPPFMNRKITRLARGVKCGGFGTRRFFDAGAGAADSKPVSVKRLARP